VTASLTPEQRAGLGRALVEWPQVVRVHLVSDGPVPMLVFEYEDGVETAGDVAGLMQRATAAAGSVLGEDAGRFGFSTGATEDMAWMAMGGEVVYERP
jgi:hypothetical protein